MSAVFTFKLSDLIAGLTRSNQWTWDAPCKAEIPTGDPASTNWNADLSVVSISECGDHLRDLHLLSKFDKQSVAQQLEEELLAVQTSGTTDATIVRKYEEET